MGHTSSEASNGRAFPTTSRPTSSHRRWPKRYWPNPPAPSARSATHPETGRQVAAKDGRYGPYVTEVLAEGEDGKPRTASLFALDVPRHDHARRGCPAPHAAANPRRHGGRGDRRRERALRPVRQARSRDALARIRGAAPHTHGRAGGGTPRPAEATSGPRRAKGAAQGGRTRSCEREADRASRTVGLARTSRTARRTQACGAETPPRGSRSSEPSSCSPKDALRARKASPEGVCTVRPSGNDLTCPRPARLR